MIRLLSTVLKLEHMHAQIADNSAKRKSLGCSGVVTIKNLSPPASWFGSWSDQILMMTLFDSISYLWGLRVSPTLH
jgi:hypothetical protein